MRGSPYSGRRASYRASKSRVGEHTFADTLLCAHLCAIFHCVQGEVDFRDGLLLLDCADGIVHVRLLVDLLLVVLHAGQTALCCLPGAVGV